MPAQFNPHGNRMPKNDEPKRLTLAGWTAAGCKYQYQTARVSKLSGTPSSDIPYLIYNLPEDKELTTEDGMVVRSPDEALELDDVDEVDVTVELDDMILKLAPG